MGPHEFADVTDGELVGALEHDPAALEEFYRRHVRALTRYVARRIGQTDPAQHAEHADDIVAATFLAALESVHGFDPQRGVPAGWLYGIANNLIAGHRRRAAADARAVARLASFRPAPAEDVSRVEERLDAARRTGSVTAVLDALPPAERELVKLVVTEALTVPEAAAQLGIRPGTARMRLARVRARLAHLLPGGRTETERGRP
jgi:RNA polymerase sigma-70 factor (ECF subfamily)